MIAVKSSKPKKQRKFFYTRKLHARQKLSSAHLNDKLRKELGQRSLRLRVGDSVRVMRGAHKKHAGKVSRVDYAGNRIFIEKLNRKKADGTEIPVPIQASNVIITDIDRDDERRVKRKVLKKKKAEAEKVEEVKAKETGKKVGEKKGKKVGKAGKTGSSGRKTAGKADKK